ncbi:hypothetical protein D3C72_2523170 [compost metagenome]
MLEAIRLRVAPRLALASIMLVIIEFIAEIMPSNSSLVVVSETEISFELAATGTADLASSR